MYILLVRRAGLLSSLIVVLLCALFRRRAWTVVLYNLLRLFNVLLYSGLLVISFAAPRLYILIVRQAGLLSSLIVVLLCALFRRRG